MTKTNTRTFVSYCGYLANQFEFPGTAGFIPHYLRSNLPNHLVVLTPGAAEGIYEGVRCLPWREVGVLVAGLEISPRGDWFECNLEDGPFGVLAWPVGDAIKVRQVRGLELDIPFRDCVLVGPAHRTPMPADDMADQDDAWLTWLDANVIVMPTERPNLAEPEEAVDDSWRLAIGDLAHMSFLRRISKV